MRSVLMALVLLLGLPQPLAGQRVHDFADVITPQDEISLESDAHAVETQTTAQLAIVTVPTLQGESIESYANQLFNSWRVGSRSMNNGVLLLVAPQERRARIEVGLGLEKLLTDARCGEILREYGTPSFKEGRFSEGILASTRALIVILEQNEALARGEVRDRSLEAIAELPLPMLFLSLYLALSVVFLVVGRILRHFRSYSTTIFLWFSLSLLFCIVGWWWSSEASPKWWQYLPILIPGISIFQNICWWKRFGRHLCSQCGAVMTLAGEKDDDGMLTPSQRIEESIGSVDYDCWSCIACNNALVTGLVENSPYTPCPYCESRAWALKLRVRVAPSMFSSGESEHVKICAACEREDVIRVEKIPSYFAQFAVTIGTGIYAAASAGSRSIGRFGGGSGSGGSSGSTGGKGGGGSYGGGSSGGGGASAGW